MIHDTNGFTVLELLIAMGIFSLLTLGVSWILISSLRTNRIVFDQLSAQGDGRKALQHIVNDIRRAEASSTGGFPLETVTTSTIIFYANIDEDGYRERVRFWLSDRTLKKGIVKPAGSPLVYNTANESIVDIGHDIVNTSTPVFSYYDENFIGTGVPLTQPVTSTDVHVVRVQLQIEKDPNKTPVPLLVESTAHIRSLKTN